jgi:hypothetical protein
MGDRILQAIRFRPVRSAESRTLRLRQETLSEDLDRSAGERSFKSARCLVQIYNGGAMGAAADLYYLGHPVLVTGTEAEGGAGTLTVDTATSVPVVVLGGVPAVGDYLTAYAVGGRWVAERTGTVGPGMYLCGTCIIPATNLTLSHVNTLDGNGSCTLTYDSVHHTWTSPCLTTIGTVAIAGGIKWVLTCSSPNLVLTMTSGNSTCTTTSASCASNGTPGVNKLRLVSLTCGSPFTAVYDCGASGADCVAFSGPGFTTLTITS